MTQTAAAQPIGRCRGRKILTVLTLLPLLLLAGIAQVQAQDPSLTSLRLTRGAEGEANYEIVNGTVEDLYLFARLDETLERRLEVPITLSIDGEEATSIGASLVFEASSSTATSRGSTATHRFAPQPQTDTLRRYTYGLEDVDGLTGEASASATFSVVANIVIVRTEADSQRVPRCCYRFISPDSDRRTGLRTTHLEIRMEVQDANGDPYTQLDQTVTIRYSIPRIGSSLVLNLNIPRGSAFGGSGQLNGVGTGREDLNTLNIIPLGISPTSATLKIVPLEDISPLAVEFLRTPKVFLTAGVSAVTLGGSVPLTLTAEEPTPLQEAIFSISITRTEADGSTPTVFIGDITLPAETTVVKTVLLQAQSMMLRPAVWNFVVTRPPRAGAAYDIPETTVPLMVLERPQITALSRSPPAVTAGESFILTVVLDRALAVAANTTEHLQVLITRNGRQGPSSLELPLSSGMQLSFEVPTAAGGMHAYRLRQPPGQIIIEEGSAEAAGEVQVQVQVNAALQLLPQDIYWGHRPVQMQLMLQDINGMPVSFSAEDFIALSLSFEGPGQPPETGSMDVTVPASETSVTFSLAFPGTTDGVVSAGVWTIRASPAAAADAINTILTDELSVTIIEPYRVAAAGLMAPGLRMPSPGLLGALSGELFTVEVQVLSGGIAVPGAQMQLVSPASTRVYTVPVDTSAVPGIVFNNVPARKLGEASLTVYTLREPEGQDIFADEQSHSLQVSIAEGLDLTVRRITPQGTVHVDDILTVEVSIRDSKGQLTSLAPVGSSTLTLSLSAVHELSGDVLPSTASIGFQLGGNNNSRIEISYLLPSTGIYTVRAADITTIPPAAAAQLLPLEFLRPLEVMAAGARRVSLVPRATAIAEGSSTVLTVELETENAAASAFTITVTGRNEDPSVTDIDRTVTIPTGGRTETVIFLNLAAGTWHFAAEAENLDVSAATATVVIASAAQVSGLSLLQSVTAGTPVTAEISFSQLLGDTPGSIDLWVSRDTEPPVFLTAIPLQPGTDRLSATVTPAAGGVHVYTLQEPEGQDIFEGEEIVSATVRVRVNAVLQLLPQEIYWAHRPVPLQAQLQDINGAPVMFRQSVATIDFSLTAPGGGSDRQESFRIAPGMTSATFMLRLETPGEWAIAASTTALLDFPSERLTADITEPYRVETLSAPDLRRSGARSAALFGEQFTIEFTVRMGGTDVSGAMMELRGPPGDSLIQTIALSSSARNTFDNVVTPDITGQQTYRLREPDGQDIFADEGDFSLTVQAAELSFELGLSVSEGRSRLLRSATYLNYRNSPRISTRGFLLDKDGQETAAGSGGSLQLEVALSIGERMRRRSTVSSPFASDATSLLVHATLSILDSTGVWTIRADGELMIVPLLLQQRLLPSEFIRPLEVTVLNNLVVQVTLTPEQSADAGTALLNDRVSLSVQLAEEHTGAPAMLPERLNLGVLAETPSRSRPLLAFDTPVAANTSTSAAATLDIDAIGIWHFTPTAGELSSFLQNFLQRAELRVRPALDISVLTPLPASDAEPLTFEATLRDAAGSEVTLNDPLSVTAAFTTAVSVTSSAAPPVRVTFEFPANTARARVRERLPPGTWRLESGTAELPVQPRLSLPSFAVQALPIVVLAPMHQTVPHASTAIITVTTDALPERAATVMLTALRTSDGASVPGSSVMLPAGMITRATAVFQAGALDTGEWTVTAMASPLGVLGAEVQGSVTVLSTPTIHLGTFPTALLDFPEIEVTVSLDSTPIRAVAITIIAQQQGRESAQVTVMLLPTQLSTAATFLTADLGLGDWMFSVLSITPQGTADDSRAASATVEIRARQDRLMLDIDRERVFPGEKITLTATVESEVSELALVIRITPPSAPDSRNLMQEPIVLDGTSGQRTFVPDADPGSWTFALIDASGAFDTSSATETLEVDAVNLELIAPEGVDANDLVLALRYLGLCGMGSTCPEEVRDALHTNLLETPLPDTAADALSGLTIPDVAGDGLESATEDILMLLRYLSGVRGDLLFPAGAPPQEQESAARLRILRQLTDT